MWLADLKAFYIARWTSGLSYHPFTVGTRVRLPYGWPLEHASAECRKLSKNMVTATIWLVLQQNKFTEIFFIFYDGKLKTETVCMGYTPKNLIKQTLPIIYTVVWYSGNHTRLSAERPGFNSPYHRHFCDWLTATSYYRELHDILNRDLYGKCRLIKVLKLFLWNFYPEKAHWGRLAKNLRK